MLQPVYIVTELKKPAIYTMIGPVPRPLKMSNIIVLSLCVRKKPASLNSNIINLVDPLPHHFFPSKPKSLARATS